METREKGSLPVVLVLGMGGAAFTGPSIRALSNHLIGTLLRPGRDACRFPPLEGSAGLRCHLPDLC